MTDSTIGNVDTETLSAHLRALDTAAATALLSRVEHKRVMEASRALDELIGSVNMLVAEYNRLFRDSDGKCSEESSGI